MCYEVIHLQLSKIHKVKMDLLCVMKWSIFNYRKYSFYNWIYYVLWSDPSSIIENTHFTIGFIMCYEVIHLQLSKIHKVKMDLLCVMKWSIFNYRKYSFYNWIYYVLWSDPSSIIENTHFTIGFIMCYEVIHLQLSKIHKVKMDLLCVMKWSIFNYRKYSFYNWIYYVLWSDPSSIIENTQSKNGFIMCYEVIHLQLSKILILQLDLLCVMKWSIFNYRKYTK